MFFFFFLLLVWYVRLLEHSPGTPNYPFMLISSVCFIIHSNAVFQEEASEKAVHRNFQTNKQTNPPLRPSSFLVTKPEQVFCLSRNKAVVILPYPSPQVSTHTHTHTLPLSDCRQWAKNVKTAETGLHVENDKLKSCRQRSIPAALLHPGKLFFSRQHARHHITYVAISVEYSTYHVQHMWLSQQNMVHITCNMCGHPRRTCYTL